MKVLFQVNIDYFRQIFIYSKSFFSFFFFLRRIRKDKLFPQMHSSNRSEFSRHRKPLSFFYVNFALAYCSQISLRYGSDLQFIDRCNLNRLDHSFCISARWSRGNWPLGLKGENGKESLLLFIIIIIIIINCHYFCWCFCLFYCILQSWNNSFFMWSPNDFGGLERILVSPEEIWAPDIVLNNK